MAAKQGGLHWSTVEQVITFLVGIAGPIVKLILLILGPR